MELAPYLYKEYGYSVNDILELVYSLNYSFYDIHKIKKIDEINKVLNYARWFEQKYYSNVSNL